MIVDTSAIIAMMRREPEAELYVDTLLGASSLKMSAGTLVELSIVASAAHPEASAAVDTLLGKFDIGVEAVTLALALVARDAYSRYGRGTRHPARLNYGDTFAYALAKATGEPLLYKGDHFAHTDIRSAI